MPKKYAFLFPGQGAQVPGMIKDISETFPEARKIVDSVSSITGVDMPHLLWESDSSILSRSDNSQLSITTASLAVVEVLKSHGITANAAMGFSLGEFPALCVSGVLSFEDCIRVVRSRGKIMQEVCEEIAKENEGHAPGMSAVIGLPPERVQEICKGLKDVYAANLNSVKQTAISGTFDGLTAAEAALKEAGARRAIRLSVAGPYHCPLMQKAADNFEKAIASVTFSDPTIELFSNVTGSKVTSGSEIKKNAVLHLTNPVLWTSEEAALANLIQNDSSSEWNIFEPGVGSVLSGLWKDSTFAEKIKSQPLNDVESLKAALGD
ncbi:MAG: ACP S-malonyltransferase [Treponema sp.]|nr:ACP S-malonyltransferase [Treponema sp.]